MADGKPDLSGKTYGALLPENLAATSPFADPDVTLSGGMRASVALTKLETLWINSGTLCNVACEHCYIESSPTNDRLVYLTKEEVVPFLDEASEMGAREIGVTGGEPFLNPAMVDISAAVLERGFDLLILTNAMRPLMRPRVQEGLLSLKKKYPQRLKLRISIDHFEPAKHDVERSRGSFAAAMDGIAWLVKNQFQISVAGRDLWREGEEEMRKGFAALFLECEFPLNAFDPKDLVLFPEMDVTGATPEITNECWGILNKNPNDVMCASSRMIVKRKGAEAPTVLSCTLLPYDERFEMGATLKEASEPVKLNHPFCSQFCVLGGASCSG